MERKRKYQDFKDNQKPLDPPGGWKKLKPKLVRQATPMPKLMPKPVRRDEVIEVRVGKVEQSFVVDKKLACSSSPFFEAMFDSQDAKRPKWKESTTMVVKLPDDAPQTFKIYQYFLTQREISSLSPAFQSVTQESADIWMRLARCYVLGDRLQDSEFKDAVVTSSINRSRQNHARLAAIPGPKIATFLYNNTTPNCALRRVLADLWAQYPHPIPWMKCSETIFHKEFLHDLCKRTVPIKQRVQIIGVSALIMSIPQRVQIALLHDQTRTLLGFREAIQGILVGIVRLHSNEKYGRCFLDIEFALIWCEMVLLR